MQGPNARKDFETPDSERTGVSESDEARAETAKSIMPRFVP